MKTSENLEEKKRMITWCCCCCCYVASVVSDSVRPHRRQPTRLPCPWDSPGRNTGVGCHFLLQCMKVKSQSEVAQSCLTLSDPMDCKPTRLLRPWDFPGMSTGEGVPCLLRVLWLHYSKINLSGSCKTLSCKIAVSSHICFSLSIWQNYSANWLERKEKWCQELVRLHCCKGLASD